MEKWISHRKDANPKNRYFSAFTDGRSCEDARLLEARFAILIPWNNGVTFLKICESEEHILHIHSRNCADARLALDWELSPQLPSQGILDATLNKCESKEHILHIFFTDRSVCVPLSVTMGTRGPKYRCIMLKFKALILLTGGTI